MSCIKQGEVKFVYRGEQRQYGKWQIHVDQYQNYSTIVVDELESLVDDSHTDEQVVDEAFC